MERYIDHIAATFGTGPGERRGYPGHQEIELALIKLYRLTGDKRRLELAVILHRRAGTRAALFHAGGAGARRRSGQLLGQDLRVQPVAHPRAPAGQDGRARGARHVHGLGDGGPRLRAERPEPEARLRGACGATSRRPRCT